MSKDDSKNRYPLLSICDEVTGFLLYTAPNSEVKVEVLLNNETLWLTQKRMAELFNVGVPAVSKHLKNIFGSEELEKNSVISILETIAEDGKNYQTKYYNLDAVISLGYRVNSAQATQFRIWATQLIKEYIIKGFALDFETQRENILPRGYARGESHFYLGRRHLLKVRVDAKTTPEVKLLRGVLEVKSREAKPDLIK